MCVCVSRLKPFTSYKFRMLSTNDVGDSVLSKETEAVTTLQDGERLGTLMEQRRKEGGRQGNMWQKHFFVFFFLTLFLCVFFSVPDEPPVILAVKPTTTTSVLVQWKVFSDFL